MRKSIVILFVFWSFLGYSQNDIYCLNDFAGWYRLSTINPTTGAITEIAPIPVVAFYVLGNKQCINSHDSTYTFAGHDGANVRLYTVHLGTGAIISDPLFNNNVVGLQYNCNDSTIYATEEFGGNYYLVTVDKTTGLTVQNGIIPGVTAYVGDGFTLDVKRGMYHLFGLFNSNIHMYSIDINTGAVINSPMFPDNLTGLAYNCNDSIVYGPVDRRRRRGFDADRALLLHADLVLRARHRPRPREPGRSLRRAVRVHRHTPTRHRRHGPRPAGRSRGRRSSTTRPGMTRVGCQGRISTVRSPVRGDVLGLGELVDALSGTFSTDARLLHAAERGGRVGHGATVQADHARLDPLAHGETSREVLGEDVARQAHLGVVRHLDHRIGVGERDDGRDRAEDLGVRDRRIWLHTAEHSRLVEVAGSIYPLPAELHRCSCAHSGLHQVVDVVDRLLVDERTAGDALVTAAADLHLPHRCGELGAELVGHTGLDQEAVGCGAGLR